MTCFPHHCPHCQADVPHNVDEGITVIVSVHIHWFPAPKADSSAALHVSLIILEAGDMEQRVKFFKCWLRKTHVVQSDRSGQIRASQRVGAQHTLWLLLLLLFCNQCDFLDTFLKVHSLIEFSGEIKKKSEQLYVASEIKIVDKASVHPCNGKGTVFMSPLFRRDQMEKKTFTLYFNILIYSLCRKLRYIS